MQFLYELRRRRVPQATVAYLAGAWLLIQIADTVFPRVGLSDASITNVIVVLAVGFIPVMMIAWVFEWTPAGLVRDSNVAADTAPGATRSIDRAIIVLLAVAVGYFAVDKFVADGEAPQSANSIIVLPFANLSSDPEQEYFADGMSEEILNLLAKVDGLRVISRSTAWTYKGKDVVISDVHKKTGVSHVLEGSVRRAGDQVRITAQLIDARTDAHIWSDTFDGRLEDVFALQDRISGRILTELQVRLSGEPPAAQPISPRAYELFLRARHIAQSYRIDVYPEAIALLESALDIEPDYVPAIFHLAFVHEISPDSDESVVRALVDRMAELEPDSSYANAFQSWFAQMYDNDYQATAHFLEKAIADDPLNPPQVLTRTAGLLRNIGRPDEAYAVTRFNMARDPACITCVNTVTRTARQTGHYEEALELINGVLTWHEATPLLRWDVGVMALQAGKPAEALEYFDAIPRDSNAPGDLGRLMALHDLDRLAEFEQEFAELRAEEGMHPESVARIYAWTRQNDAAFDWIQKTIDLHGPAVVRNFKTDLYSRLADDPRYNALLEDYGFSDEDMSHIQFDPPYPPAIRAEIDRIMSEL